MSNDCSAPRTEKRKADRRPRPATATQQLLTLTQVEQLYGIPYRSVYDLITMGKLPVVRFFDGGLMRIRRPDLEKLIEQSIVHQHGA
jgi:excisionase family DNA binding protein